MPNLESCNTMRSLEGLKYRKKTQNQKKNFTDSKRYAEFHFKEILRIEVFKSVNVVQNINLNKNGISQS